MLKKKIYSVVLGEVLCILLRHLRIFLSCKSTKKSKITSLTKKCSFITVEVMQAKENHLVLCKVYIHIKGTVQRDGPDGSGRN